MSTELSKPTCFNEALEQFERMEQELELPIWMVNGVYVWKLLRFKVFSQFRMCHGLTEEAHPETRRLRKTKGQLVKEFPGRFIQRNPYRASRAKTDRIIIPSSRKQWMAEQLLEPYSVRAWVGANEARSLVLDRTSPLDPAPLPGAPDFDVMARLGWIARQFVRVHIDESDRNRMRSIQQRLGTDLVTNGRSFDEQILRAVREFVGQRLVFRTLFWKTQPKALYVVTGYGREAPIAAAQEQGIPVAEFQHGSMDRGHLAYDYRGWEKVPYFADYLLTWGEAWYRNTALPQHCKLHPVGAPHIELPMREAVLKSVRYEKRLLVLSEGRVAEDLMGAVIQFSRLRPDWEIVVRPHPSESVSSLSSHLQSLDSELSKRIYVDKEPSLAQACSQVSVVFGVSSTALVECLLVGCKVVMLRLPSAAPYFQPLLDDGEARAVLSGEELADCIEVLPQGTARNYFAEPVEDVCRLVEMSRFD